MGGFKGAIVGSVYSYMGLLTLRTFISAHLCIRTMFNKKVRN